MVELPHTKAPPPREGTLAADLLGLVRRVKDGKVERWERWEMNLEMVAMINLFSPLLLLEQASSCYLVEYLRLILK